MKPQVELFHSLRTALAAGTPAAEMEKALWERYGRTLAVLVLDTSGFTRTARAQGVVAFLQALVRLRDLVAHIMEAQGGRDIRFEADNAYALFDTADAAVQAACAVHRAVAAAGVSVGGEETLQVCIGIGYGLVLYAGEEGVYGDEMNCASKLGEDVAAPYDTLLTEAAYESLAASRRALLEAERRTVSIATVELPYWAVREVGFTPPEV